VANRKRSRWIDVPAISGENMEMSRRHMFKSVAAGSVIVASGLALPVPAAKAQSGQAKRSSNETTVDASKVKVTRLTEGGLHSFFGICAGDTTPGPFGITINSLPFGTKVISVWVTEVYEGASNLGAAIVSTTSVQLAGSGMYCRVLGNLDWDHNLRLGCQCIYGPES